MSFKPYDDEKPICHIKSNLTKCESLQTRPKNENNSGEMVSKKLYESFKCFR